jgi:hypothetical protein
MTTKNNSEIKESKSGTAKVVIVICVLIIIGAVFAGVVTVYNNNFALPDKAVVIENIFVDIDGDGLLDFVRYAEVIVNTGVPNLSPSP